jgi:DNA-binding transcriptional ArsR family regulator
MPDPQDRLHALEEQMAAFQTRLTALEDLVSSQRQEGAASAFPLAEATSDHELHPPQTGTVQGTLRYAGSIQIGERPFRFQQTLTVASIFEAEPSLMASIFAALSSPHRVIILRTLCERACTAQQLQEVLGMGSSGQLYHHLKELMAAGLIAQRERSSAYTIDPAKVIPICAALMVAFSLATFFRGTEQSAPLSQSQGDDPAEHT